MKERDLPRFCGEILDGARTGCSFIEQGDGHSGANNEWHKHNLLVATPDRKPRRLHHAKEKATSSLEEEFRRIGIL